MAPIIPSINPIINPMNSTPPIMRPRKENTKTTIGPDFDFLYIRKDPKSIKHPKIKDIMTNIKVGNIWILEIPRIFGLLIIKTLLDSIVMPENVERIREYFIFSSAFN